jgi:hypothetical protein
MMVSATFRVDTAAPSSWEENSEAKAEEEEVRRPERIYYSYD